MIAFLSLPFLHKQKGVQNGLDRIYAGADCANSSFDKSFRIKTNLRGANLALRKFISQRKHLCKTEMYWLSFQLIISDYNFSCIGIFESKICCIYSVLINGALS